MRNTHWLAGVGIALLSAVPAVAGDESTKAALNTDRPDFTESSITVPAGRLQLEAGITYEKGGGTRLLSGPEALFRYGVGERTELRFIAPDYFRARGAERRSGWGDAAIGFKQQLGPVDDWDFALIAHATLPTHGRFSSDHVDPEVALTWARGITGRLSVAGLFGFFFPSEDGDRNFTFAPTLSFGYSLGGRWATFLEYAAEFPETGGDVHLLHHGYTYALSDLQQLDIHFGFGLSRAAPDLFIGGGYAVRF